MNLGWKIFDHFDFLVIIWEYDSWLWFLYQYHKVIRCLSVYLKPTYLCICVSIYLSIYLSISFYPSIYLSILPSIYLSVYIYLSVSIYISLSILSIYLSIKHSFSIPIYPQFLFIFISFHENMTFLYNIIFNHAMLKLHLGSSGCVLIILSEDVSPVGSAGSGEGLTSLWPLRWDVKSRWQLNTCEQSGH